MLFDTAYYLIYSVDVSLVVGPLISDVYFLQQKKCALEGMIRKPYVAGLSYEERNALRAMVRKERL